MSRNRCHSAGPKTQAAVVWTPVPPLVDTTSQPATQGKESLRGSGNKRPAHSPETVDDREDVARRKISSWPVQSVISLCGCA